MVKRSPADHREDSL